MSSQPKNDDSVGYKRPPKATRWKKGQTGNLNRKFPRNPKPILDILDGLLLAPVDIIESGKSRRVTALEAILLQQLQKEIAGDLRATRVRLSYQEIAAATSEKSGVEVVWVDSEYTRMLSEMGSNPAEPKPESDDEQV
jgi:hypothetical protein